MRTVNLLSFEETTRRLRVTSRSYLGVREVPLTRIIGSVGRSQDLDRGFRGRPGLSDERLRSLRTAFPDGDTPAIDVFEIGGSYFVEDGHHRVAYALERHAEFIDAQVTRLHTNYRIGPEVDICQLVHTEQQHLLLEQSGLSQARPEATIEFTLLDGYTQTSDIIKAHGYDLARGRGELPTPPEIAAHWYDTVYLPAVAAAERASLPQLYETWHSTDGDLFLWLYQIRRDLRGHDPTVDFDTAARHARHLNLGRRRKRDHLRNGRRPLPLGFSP
jgi:hypothetical protein